MIQSKVQNDPKEINRGMIKQKQAKRCDLSHVRSCVQHNVNRNEGMEFTEHVPTANEIALQKKDGAPKVETASVSHGPHAILVFSFILRSLAPHQR